MWRTGKFSEDPRPKSTIVSISCTLGGTALRQGGFVLLREQWSKGQVPDNIHIKSVLVHNFQEQKKKFVDPETKCLVDN